MSDHVSKLEGLKVLNLSHNAELTSLPKQLFSLPNLNVLKVDHANLSVLPDFTPQSTLEELVSLSLYPPLSLSLTYLCVCICVFEY